MSKKKIKLLVWVIEDDPLMRKFWPEKLKGGLEDEGIDVKTKAFAFTQDALKSKGTPDCIFYDVSRGVGGFGCDPLSWAVPEVCHLYEKFPQTIVAVYSAVSIWAQDTIDEIIEELKERKIFLVHVGYGNEKEWFNVLRHVAETKQEKLK